MSKVSTAAFLGMLALTMTGCGLLNNQQTDNPTPSTAPVVQTPPPVKPPLVVQNPNNAAYLAPGLIQPTNANQRAKLVAKGNRDPFAALFVPVPVSPVSAGNIPYGNSSAPIQRAPTVSSPTTSRQTSSRINAGQSTPNSVTINNSRSASNQSNSNNRTASSNASRRTAANPSAQSAQSAQRRTSTASSRRTPSGQAFPGVNAGQSGSTSSNQNIPFPLPPALPDSNLQPLPPAPQEPELARNVVVTGVIQIGEQAQAIVQVPSEPTSRYVQVGQRLSNGQVLVKRIELNTGAEPLVILEQYGVEVSKTVGEQAPSQGQQATPTSAVPQVPPQNTNTATAELPASPNASVAAR